LLFEFSQEGSVVGWWHFGKSRSWCN